MGLIPIERPILFYAGTSLAFGSGEPDCSRYEDTGNAMARKGLCEQRGCPVIRSRGVLAR